MRSIDRSMLSICRLFGVGVTVGILSFFSVEPSQSLFAQDAVVEQCANDGDGSNDTCASSGSVGWITGNVNGNRANYKEGDFLPARQILTGLTPTYYYCFGVGWDVTSSSLPAVDYIGSYDATLPNADPTDGSTLNSGSPDDTLSIPSDPALSGTIMGNSFSGSQQSGVLSLWGGTFDASSLKYSITGSITHPATSPQSLEYCFTANKTEVILSFGLHIAVGAEWGDLARPSGSPYHVSNGTRNGQFTNPIRTSETDLACLPPGGDPVNDATHQSVGRKEVQMQVSAIESGTIKIVKNIEGGTPDDTFTFDLQDGTPQQIANPSITTSGGTGMSSVIVVSPGTFSIEETLPPGWSLLASGTSCVPNGSGTVGTLSGTTITNITVADTDDVVCTFTNEKSTYVSLANFTATTVGDDVVVAWTTAAEVHNAGFNLYGSASPTGPWTRINADLISAEGDPFSTTQYSFVDTTGAAYYLLKDVDTKGTATPHGPVGVSGSANGSGGTTPIVFIPFYSY